MSWATDGKVIWEMKKGPLHGRLVLPHNSHHIAVEVWSSDNSWVRVDGYAAQCILEVAYLDLYDEGLGRVPKRVTA